MREWRSIIGKIETTKSNKERLEGGGRKCNYGELEEELVLWIHGMRSKMLHVSRKMIMFKAKKMMDEKKHRSCNSTFIRCKQGGWGEKFMKRHGFSLRRKTTTAQKDPSLLVDRLVAFGVHVRRLQKVYSYAESAIVAMDETPVWSDMISNTTVEITGSKDVPMKSTGHEKVRVLCLSGGEIGRYRMQAIYCFCRCQKRIEITERRVSEKVLNFVGEK